MSTRKSDLCRYPGCDAPDPQPPYRYLRDGIPSVTTIAGLLDDGKSRKFAWSASAIAADYVVHGDGEWARMVSSPCDHAAKRFCPSCAAIRAEFDRRWSAKADLGSHVHHLACSWAHGDSVYGDVDTNAYLDAIAAFYTQHQPRWLLTERTISGGDLSTRYRGKFDGICEVDCPVADHDRCRWIVDYKTGGFYPLEQTLQLAAYRFGRLTTWEDMTEHVGEPVPSTAHAGVILLRGDGGFELVELPADEFAIDGFMGLRRSWDFRRRIETWEKNRQADAETKGPVPA